MTDWQAVRDWLAETVMGYAVESELDGVHGPIEWYTLNGEYVGECSDWRPDTLWADCGMVIEAMHAKGWGLTIHSYPHPRIDEYFAMYAELEGGERLLDLKSARADTFCEAVCLAAAYATGYEEATDDLDARH